MKKIRKRVICLQDVQYKRIHAKKFQVNFNSPNVKKIDFEIMDWKTFRSTKVCSHIMRRERAETRKVTWTDEPFTGRVSGVVRIVRGRMSLDIPAALA